MTHRSFLSRTFFLNFNLNVFLHLCRQMCMTLYRQRNPHLRRRRRHHHQSECLDPSSWCRNTALITTYRTQHKTHLLLL